MIRIERLCHAAGGFALRDVSLEVPSGEYCVLVGPTGAGKTLLVECVAGLRRVDAGEVFFNGARVTDLPPERRNVGYVPQEWAVFPFLSVRENVALGLKLRRVPRAAAAAAMERVAAMLDLGPLLGRAPATLSGGEKQRVALARALAADPDYLLLDEPYSSLDWGTRHALWTQMSRLHRAVGKTALHITHDLEEAFTLATQVAVLIGGRIRQVGTREEVFYHPRDREVAAFLGIRNILTGRVAGVDAAAGKMRVACRQGTFTVPCGEGAREGREVTFCVSPYEVKIIRDARPVRDELAENLLRARITGMLSHGMTHTVFVSIVGAPPAPEGHDFELRVHDYSFVKLDLREGKEIQLSLRRKAITVLGE